MAKNGALVIHRFRNVVPYGRAAETPGPFKRSDITIGKSVPELSKIFDQGRVDKNLIRRSLDGDEVIIPVTAGLNGSTRHFQIILKPISLNSSHIVIKDLTNPRPEKILDNTYAAVEINSPKIEGENTFFASHLKREIQYLGRQYTKSSQTAVDSNPSKDRSIAQSLASNENNTDSALELSKPRKEYMSKGGVRIYAQEHTVGKVLSTKNVKKIHVTKNLVSREVKVLRPQMPDEAEQMIKFKLSNPTQDAADLTVVDKFGKELLSNAKITVDRSVIPKRDHKVALALHHAVLDLAA
jgi:hypothetical protein